MNDKNVAKDVKVVFDRDLEDQDESVNTASQKPEQEIFEKDLDSLINQLHEFKKKYSERAQFTFIIKENNEEKPKIYIPNHPYDTAVLITKSYNYITGELMRDLTAGR